MLSMETTDDRESMLGISVCLTPQLILVDTTDVASLLAVSMKAIAVHNPYQQARSQTLS